MIIDYEKKYKHRCYWFGSNRKLPAKRVNYKKRDIELKTGKRIRVVAISAKNPNKKRFKINKNIFYKNPLDIIKRGEFGCYI